MFTFTRLVISTNLLGAGLLILIMIWLAIFRDGFQWKSDPRLQFNWHPMLMAVGMIVLQGHAILLFRILRNTRKYTVKLIHAALNLCGYVFTIVGLKAVFDYHNESIPPKPNMYSLHSWIGLFSVILFACQWSAGLIIFLYPGLDVSIKGFYHPIHVSVGIVGFVFASAAALLGFLETAIFHVKDYSSFKSEGILINCMGVMILFYSILVVYLVTEPRFKRMNSTENETLLAAKE